MKKFSIALLLFLSGCASTNKPNEDLTLEQMKVHPIVMVSPKKAKGVSFSDDVWVDFDFELKPWSGSHAVRPSNIVAVDSSHPQSPDLIKVATKAFSKWVYKTESLNDYDSKRYVVRLSAKSSSKFEGFICSSFSCIKQ